ELGHVEFVLHYTNKICQITGVVVIERQKRESERITDCYAARRTGQGSEGNRQYRVGGVQVRNRVGIGATGRTRGQVRDKHPILTAKGARGEVPDIRVEDVQIVGTVVVNVDINIEFGRYIGMRPLAISIDRELNSKGRTRRAAICDTD